MTLSARSRSPVSWMPSAVLIADITNAGSRTGTRSTNTASSRNVKDRQGQVCLPGPWCSDQRQQAHLVALEEAADLSHFPISRHHGPGEPRHGAPPPGVTTGHCHWASCQRIRHERPARKKAWRSLPSRAMPTESHRWSEMRAHVLRHGVATRLPPAARLPRRLQPACVTQRNPGGKTVLVFLRHEHQPSRPRHATHTVCTRLGSSSRGAGLGGCPRSWTRPLKHAGHSTYQ
jgi:hypothetical protein